MAACCDFEWGHFLTFRSAAHEWGFCLTFRSEGHLYAFVTEGNTIFYRYTVITCVYIYDPDNAYFTLLLYTRCIHCGCYTDSHLVFRGPRSLGLFLDLTKSFQNFGHTDHSMVRFVLVRLSAFGRFGCLPFLDFWIASVWCLINHSRSHVTGNESGSRSTVSRFLQANDSARRCPTDRLHTLTCTPVPAKRSSNFMTLTNPRTFTENFFSFLSSGFCCDVNLLGQIDYLRTSCSVRSDLTLDIDLMTSV